VLIVALLAAGGLSGCAGAAGNASTVTVLGSWTGTEKAGFLAMIHGFEQKNDNRIQVIYHDTRDAPAVLATDLKNGHPPDLAVLATPGAMDQDAAAGTLLPIDKALDLQSMNRQYGSGWLQVMQATGPSGSKNYYAIIVKAALKSVIWYDPGQFPPRDLGLLTSTDLTWNQLTSLTEQLAATGLSPWCIGMADASNSGWPGTDWIEDIVLHQSGLQAYDQWVAGTLPWTSASITQAWQAFGQVAATPGLVHGGTLAELITPYGTAGQPMFNSKLGCYLEHQGSFITGSDFYGHDTLGSSSSSAHPQPGTGFNFIPFPPLASADRNNLEVAGDLLGMFHDTPAAEKFIAYLTTPPAQEVWTSLPRSGAISANRDVPASSYPDAVSRNIANILKRAGNVRFDASDSMPPTMENAFNSAVLLYLDNPGQLHIILQRLDEVQKAAYPRAGVSTSPNGT
jgi:alpha-glucoside transport system substrate-binding protein